VGSPIKCNLKFQEAHPKIIVMNYTSLLSPTGPLTLFEEAGEIIAVEWGQTKGGSETPLLHEAKDQISQYFARERQIFELPLNPKGTEFQKAVWQQMLEIPYGQTKTYGALAKNLKSAARAVGGACGKNPIPIIIPCHRVMGANGKLTGFSGGEGVATKEALLRLESFAT
jgi:methylated-DNA-[protein]-cysteine S-methyltransferase